MSDSMSNAYVPAGSTMPCGSATGRLNVTLFLWGLTLAPTEPVSMNASATAALPMHTDFRFQCVIGFVDSYLDQRAAGKNQTVLRVFGLHRRAAKPVRLQVEAFPLPRIPVC